MTLAVVPLISQRVHHLDINNGLCTNSLTDLTLDHHGNMWIGSYSGLMKYSGTHIKCFTKFGIESDAISGPEMHSVCEDNCGFIWIGTTAGLDKINPVTFEVEHYPIRSPFKGSSSVGYIYSVHADRFDFLWFSTDVALFKFDINTGHYEAIPTENSEHGVPSTYVLYNGYVEKEDGIWMSTGRGMVFYEFKTQNFFHRSNNPQSKTIFNVERTINDIQSDLEEDAEGKIWFIREHQQLMSYDVATDDLDTFDFQKPPGTWKCCWSVGVDARENIWIGSRHGGIFIFNKASGTFSSLKNEGINRLVRSDYIYSIERGPEGQMFVAHDAGLDIIDLYDLSLREFKLSARPDFLNLKYQSGEITFDESGQSVYVPFFKGGFFKHDLKSDLFRHYQSPVTADGYLSIIYPHDGKEYAAVNGNLLRFEIIGDSVNLSDNYLLPDTLGKTHGQVIWCYVESPTSIYIKKNSGKLFHINDGGLKMMTGIGFKPNICLSPDSQTISYLTENLNLVRIDLRHQRHDTIYLQKKLLTENFSFSNPRNMVDDGSAIWMTGQNGILRYNYNEQKINSYSVGQGLSHGFTFSIVLDRNNNIWVGSIGGIDKFDKKTNRFVSIYPMDDNTYMDAFGSALCSKDGKLIFHFGNKLIELQPDFVSGSLHAHQAIHLNEVLVNGKPIDWQGSSKLSSLRHDENRLTFSYDILLFDESEPVSFQYRLNEKSWIDNGERNEVNLDGLAGGRYELELRGTVGSLNNSTPTLTVPFRIRPPWWKEWWFLTLIFLSIVAGLWVYYRSRINKYKTELIVARQISDLESKALRAQMNPHFVFNSLNAIQECIVTGRVDEAYTYLAKFSRLLRLVLEHSDIGEVTLQQELEVLDLYISLEKLRFKNDMHYQFELDDDLDPEEIWMPPMLIQPHIENAIWHGLRHKEGEKNLTLSIKETIPDYLEVIIQDDGVGRTKSSLMKKNRLGGTNHQSKGKQLSENRMELLRNTYPLASMIITDLYREEGEAAGTKVILMIPMMKKTL